MTVDLLAPVPAPSVAFIPSPTVERFMAAVAQGSPGEMRMVVLQSPRGEGKTTAAIYAALVLAERLRAEGGEGYLPVRVAVVRDTWISLDRTTLRTFEEQRLQGLPVVFGNGRREARVADDVEWNFFGLDRPEDADKFQGFTCGLLWIEEPAPAAGLTAGVPIESLAIGATSIRQPGVPPRIILTMNPPDSDSWVLKVEERLRDAGLEHLRVVVFKIPQGEKSAHFRALAAEAATTEEAAAWDSAASEFDRYRERNRALLTAAGRLDLVARLVEGQVGDVQVGEAVVPVFSREQHVAKASLEMYQSRPIIRCWDGGGTPSCVWLQDLDSRGGVNVLASRTGQNVSMEEFIRDQVLPLQRTYGWSTPAPTREGWPHRRAAGVRFRDIGDPSMLHEGKTVSADLTSALVIQQMLNTGFEPGPVSWSARREALLSAFGRVGRGDRPRFVQIDPDENDMLIRALAGRFHYPKDLATGRVVMTVEAAKRISGLFAQSPDALAYGLATLHPADEWVRATSVPTVRRAAPEPRSWVGR